MINPTARHSAFLLAAAMSKGHPVNFESLCILVRDMNGNPDAVANMSVDKLNQYLILLIIASM